MPNLSNPLAPQTPSKLRRIARCVTNPINTRKGKRAFIRTLTTNIRNQILAAIPKMPAEWTGHELREYLATLTDCERTNEMKTNRKRRKDYQNVIWTQNL